MGNLFMSKENKSTEYILSQLELAQSIINECRSLLGGSSKKAPKVKPPKVKETGSTDYRNEICNKIKECEESEKIESQILDKTSAENRILLPLYICFKYFPQQRLSTGDIEKITAELNVRVKTPNVAKAISEKLWKYLDSNSTRVKGKVTLYKLNRKGEKYFLSILNKENVN